MVQENLQQAEKPKRSDKQAQKAFGSAIGNRSCFSSMLVAAWGRRLSLVTMAAFHGKMKQPRS